MFRIENDSLEDILKEITNLNSAKNGADKNSPTRWLKEVADICSPIFTQIWSNEIINKETFTTMLKLAGVTPVF